MKVPHMFHVCLVIFAVLLYTGSILVTRNPEFMEEEKQEDNAVEVQTAVCDIRFWHLGVMLFNGVFFGTYVASVYKGVALTYVDDKTLTLAGSLGSFSNGASRLLWASLMDCWGFKRVYSCLIVLQLIASIFIYHSRESAFFYTLMVFLAFLCEGGHFSTFPAQGVKMYGLKHGGKIFTLCFFAVPSSALLGFALVQHHEIIDPKHIFIFGAILTAVNGLLLLLFDDE